MTANSNLPEFTVGEISTALKRTVEEAFALVRVRGEISGFKRHTSGHCYLRLKDDQAVLDAVVWRTSVARLAVKPEEGLEVIVTGRITTYPGRSSYQIVIEAMEVAGEGALLKLLEERRRRLGAEGLFDPARKKRLPFLPEVVGVVTSPTGAVIRDILHRLADRCPRHVLLWPVAVQGETAAAQVAAAIAGFNRIAPGGPVPRPDVLIVARGGGSLEDLWPFNDEAVVRAAAASAIPLISAVGHETDTTLIDFAADVRAPTPSAAAEMAVPVRADILAQVDRCGGRLASAVARALSELAVRVEGLGRGLPEPNRLIADGRRRLDDRAERLGNAMTVLAERRRAELDRSFARLQSPREQIGARAHAMEQLATRLAHAAANRVGDTAARLERAAGRLRPEPLRADTSRHARTVADLGERLAAAAHRTLADAAGQVARSARVLESVSYESVLQRGFAVVWGADGHVIERAGAAHTGPVTLEFHDGKVAAMVDGAPAQRPGAKGKGKGIPGQGDLF